MAYGFRGGTTAWSSTTSTRILFRCGLKAFLDSEADLEVVGEAEGGAQALELLARLASKGRQPHVVVMDLQMEPLDGIESTRRIRSGYSGVEVVALTSFGEGLVEAGAE